MQTIETMPPYFVIRTTCYSVMLFLGLGEVILGIFTMVYPGQSILLSWFSMALLAIAVLSSLWICVLLMFNDRPRSRHLLCQARTHYISNVIISGPWFIVAVMMALLLPDECHALLSEDNTTWFCGATIGECVTAWILFAISVFVAAYIHRRSQRFGLLSNIAQSSKTHLRLDDIPVGMAHHMIKGYP